VRLIAFGDIHEHVGDLAALRPYLEGADALIVTGDLTNYAGKAKARQVLDAVRALHPRVFAQLGNLDLPEVDELLTGEGINLHGRGVRLGEVGIAGCGGSNRTPFATPTEFGEEEIAALLERGFSQIEDAPFRILVPHCPPRGTKLDRTRAGLHVGSPAVREFIERRRPHLVLTGHIHEARGVDDVDGVPVINAGPLRDGGFVDVVIGADGVHAALRQIGGRG
jgi:Icc-related predicted phosphoesterase